MLVEQSLYKAIKICGGKQKKLADAIGEKPDKIRYWLSSGKQIPFHNAIAIEVATDEQVSRFDLAPYARFKNHRLHIAINKPISSTISISERVAIGIAFENSLGKRNGERNDIKPRRNFSQVKGKTSTLAAKQAGFNSRDTYLFAKKIIKNGIFDLVQAVDEKQIAISSAALIAQLTPEEQKSILQQSSKQINLVIKQLRTSKNKTPSEKIIEAEKNYQLPLRLALLGLKTYCSEKNRFPWDPLYLRNQVFPYIEIDFTKILDALSRNGFVLKIQHKNHWYGKIICPTSANNDRKFQGI